MSIFQWLSKGGPLVWPIIFLGILALVLSFERLLFFHKDKIKASDFLEGIKNLITKQRLLEAITLCQETSGSVPRLIKTALINYKNKPENILSAMRQTALCEFFVLERRLGSIGIIARISPIIGLIGTCISLFNGFYKLHMSGVYANIQMFASDVYSAIITTIVGLTVATFAFLAHHFLNSRLRAIVHDMEWTTNEILEFLQNNSSE